MASINIFNALRALGKPSEKEEVIAEVARQQNVRFNNIPMLYENVAEALQESQILGLVVCNDGKYIRASELLVRTSEKSSSTTELNDGQYEVQQLRSGNLVHENTLIKSVPNSLICDIIEEQSVSSIDERDQKKDDDVHSNHTNQNNVEDKNSVVCIPQ